MHPKHPPLQPSATFQEVLATELSEIAASRQKRRVPSDVGTRGDAFERARDSRLAGLAFSGGGIRSATFCLGVLEALAEMRLLRLFDYLSTVSGGGYIGGWLSAWIRRAGIDQVEAALAPPRGASPAAAAEPSQVSWLRRFSNYLTPQLGLLSSDTAAFIATYIRNTLLNLLIVVAALSAVLLAPRILGLLMKWLKSIPGAFMLPEGVPLALSIGFLAVATRNLGQSLAMFRLKGEDYPPEARQGFVLQWIVVPLFLAAYLMAGVFEGFAGRMQDASQEIWAWIGGAALLYSGCWALEALSARRSAAGDRPKESAAATCGSETVSWRAVLISALGAGAVGGLVLFGIRLWIANWPSEARFWLSVSWAPALLIVAFSLTVILHIGLTGLGLPESQREWFSRLGGMLLTGNFAWIALFAFAIYAPLAIQWLNTLFHGWMTGGLSVAWVLSTLQGLLAGQSPKTGEPNKRSPLELLARLAPLIFVIGLLAMLSEAVYSVLGAVHRTAGFSFWAEQDLFATPWLWAYLVGLAGLALLLSARVDLNSFSLHYLYQKRLARCYLGASNPRRRPHPFTGFDPRDDLPLDRFRSSAPPTEDEKTAPTAFEGPYPIVNTALNLTSLSSNELAWQERKALSFSFTPRFSGYQPPALDRAAPQNDPHREVQTTGYRPTAAYGGGVCLGAAIAISGAAASPNMGYHTSAPVAFLMTLFNARLGWWLGNPLRQVSWRKSGPRLGLFYLFNELLGRTGDQARYVYLSDGGHFENLAIYELVRRRCRLIVACDAEQDGLYQFNGLGSAIRKCRSDFGIEIEIGVEQIRPHDGKDGEWHCAIGTIHYEHADPLALPGTLVYLKSSLTGNEPSDVLNYALEHPAFPHESTSDQWFGESQFESYRALGYHIACTTFQPALKTLGAAAAAPASNPEELLVGLRQAWYPPSKAVTKHFTRLGEEVNRLYAVLRNDTNLEFLDPHFYPEWSQVFSQTNPVFLPPNLWLPPEPEKLRAGFYFCSELLQLMENVYLDLDLENDCDHPDARGWMNLFRHWSWSSMVRLTWAVAASTYGARFQTFAERQFGLERGRVRIDPILESGEATPYARLKGTLAAAAGRSVLNFLECELLLEVAAANPSILQEGVTIYALRIAVKNDLGTRDPLEPGPDPEDVALTFGVALTTGKTLRYFRIQDHLRKTGLARLALRTMFKEHLVEKVEPALPRPESREPVSDREANRFRRFFESVRWEMEGAGDP